MEFLLFYALAVYLLLAVYFAKVAHDRGQEPILILVLGILTTPVLSGFVLIVSRPPDAVIMALRDRSPAPSPLPPVIIS